MVFVTTYKQIRKTSLRSFVRNNALNVLSFAGNLRHVDNSIPRIQFVYLHHVFADEEQSLRDLLNFLSKQYTFISYSDAVSKLYSNAIDKPYICFSTDDGFKNNLKAAEIFNEYNIKVCFFLCPDIIGIKDNLVVRNFCSEKLHLPSVEFLDWNDMEVLQKQGHEIGSHTCTHVDLAISGNVIEEITLSKQKLEAKAGTIKHFAYPYGRYFHINRSAFNAVFNAGYLSCASAERGCHVNGERNGELPLIRRDQVVLNWKLSHIKYFFNRNVSNKSFQAYLPPF